MKISSNQISEFLKSPSAEFQFILCYGPDDGLVRERADLIAGTVANDLSDPFLVSNLAESELLEDRARLGDEIAALTLTGGRRVVRIRNATDAVSPILKTQIETNAGDALIVVRAGNLGPRSVLRKLFETYRNSAAVACYVDDDRMLARVISHTFSERGISVTPGALEYLQNNLGSDRGVTRSELTKLAIYAGKSNKITIDDAMACVGDNTNLHLESLAFAVGDGNQTTLCSGYIRCLNEGITPVTVLRTVQKHLTRLQLVITCSLRTGKILESMQALKPPVFFKFRAQFQRQVRNWSTQHIELALGLLLDAEIEAKQSARPEADLCGHALTQIAQLTNNTPSKIKSTY